MATATVGALRVVLGLDSGAFTDGLSAAQKHLKDAGAKMQRVGAGLATVGAGMSAAITAPFIALGFHLLQGSQDAAAAAAQVNAALTSMGDASGKTFDQLAKAAEGLRNLSGVDDDEIMTKVTANLLTFGKVSGDVFDRAQLSILNLSARMGSDLQGATMMVGKALNDPVQGLAALRRVGIQFTADQQNMIKAMTEVGNVAGAQAIMLGELERQFGGAAEAAGNADVWKPMKTALMDLEGAFEPIVRDVLGPLIAKVAEITRAFANLSPETQKFIAIGAAVAAAIGPLLVGLGGVVTAVGALLPVFGAVAAVMSGPVILAVGAAVLAFLAFKDDIIPAVMQFATTLKEVLGPKIQPLFEALKGAVSAVGEMFGAIFGGGSGSSNENLKVWGQSIAQVFGAALDLITGAINVITNVFRALGALLRGDFSAMWGFLWQAVKSAVSAILNAFETLFPGVLNSVRKMVEGVSGWLQGKLFDVLKGVIERVKWVSDAFFKLYDAVVGHSYIPDMVIEIGQWMQRLDQNMVGQARKATQSTAEAFEEVRQRANDALEGLLSDNERAWREHAQTVKALQDGIALGGPDAAAYRVGLDRENAGWDARRLSLPSAKSLGPVGDIPGVQAINDAVASMNQAINDSREKFADAFEYGIDAALRGDWEGLLRSIVGDSFRDGLKSIGRSLFDAFKGGGSSGGGWSNILSSAGSWFSKLPGFKTGGSFRVGGSGGIDSSLVAFRATPGEMVDVRRPGQNLGGGVTRVVVDVNDDRFNAYVDARAAPIAAQAAVGAVTIQRADARSAGRRQRQRFV
ncbi:hypothetical protein [Brevundimonas sp.]|uniref:phage tail protein n=1 Tax=Brevundimonas sp. TaxID=1871086 RepID=UPI0028ABEADA|nr:hypothetical protein [Brevundimonas sp.]